MSKQEVIEHLKYMVEEITGYIIPAQTEEDVADLFKKDKEALEEAIKYLKEG